MGNDNLVGFLKNNFLGKVYVQQYKVFPYMVQTEYT